jgi:hypothetical protein
MGRDSASDPFFPFRFSVSTLLLLQCCFVADWRQIQGRIRRARTGPDAAAKLTALFDKTRDGMVAFELAQLMENSGQSETAVHWYTTAAQRFRRADWKQKAVAALERMGAPVPAIGDDSQPLAAIPSIAAPEESSPASEQPAEENEAQPEPAPAQTAEGAPPTGPKKRRRGRRGGRGRGKRGRQPATQAAAPPVAAERRVEREALPARKFAPPPPADEIEPEPEPVRERASAPPALRQGEPALASRMAQLESQLRRLIAAATHTLDDVDGAPAGPGVYLLSDSDQVTHYYVEAARTLRIALDHLAKGRSGGQREAVSLRPALAEHLGISEAKVKDYLRKHCTVRWVQIDEGASHLAHFAIAVLKPALNQ